MAIARHSHKCSHNLRRSRGRTLSESNWRRSIGWSLATAAVGRPTLRPRDLRHTAASIWLGAGADPKVVQRVLGHASAAMTMDLYGHLSTRTWGSRSTGSGAHPGGREEAGAHGKTPSTGIEGA
jgi:integrase